MLSCSTSVASTMQMTHLAQLLCRSHLSNSGLQQMIVYSNYELS
jgi:hypothetical protein